MPNVPNISLRPPFWLHQHRQKAAYARARHGPQSSCRRFAATIAPANAPIVMAFRAP
jgi:hypothetical protein